MNMKPNHEQVIKFLASKIQEIDGLKNRTEDSPEFIQWHTSTKRILGHSFGEQSPEMMEFQGIFYSPSVSMGMQSSKKEEQTAYREGLRKAKAVLEGIVEGLNLGLPSPANHAPAPSTGGGTVINISQNQSVTLTIENALQNNLTGAQHEELRKILSEQNGEQKKSKLKNFLVNVGEKTLVAILIKLLL